MSGFDAEVIVVGGGPAGAASAWTLARGGRDVLVLDRAVFPRPKPCAEYVSPEASRILQDMNVLGAAERAGASLLTGMRVRAPDGTELIGEFAAARDCGRGTCAGSRCVVSAWTRCCSTPRARPGANVRENAHVVDVVRDTTGRVDGVSLADGSTLRARLVIGADGLRSIVARRLGLGIHARWPRRVAFVTHYEGVSGMQDYGEMHVDRDGYVGLAPVDSGLVNVAVVIPATLAHFAASDPAGIRRELGAPPATARAALSRTRDARRRCAARDRSAGARAARGRPARRSWATRRISSTRSPAKASTRRSAARNCSLRTRTPCARRRIRATNATRSPLTIAAAATPSAASGWSNVWWDSPWAGRR